MVIESLEIKNKYYYNWDDFVYTYDFDEKLVKITKRESRMMLIFITLLTYLKVIS